MSCRSCAAVVLVVAMGSIAQAADESPAVKEAYLKYVQARMDRDLEAAMKASTGDELARQFLEADIQRQKLMTRFREVVETKIGAPGSRPSSRPASQPAVPRAAEVWGSLASSSTVEIKGDTARMQPKTGNGYGFKKVDGQWKADLNNWEGPVPDAEAVKMMQAAIPMMQQVIAEVESGKIKTQQELRQVMDQRERELREKMNMSPASRPAAR